jgi:superoxide reductase
MSNIREMYRCGRCGQLVGIAVAGGGQLVCCGEPMKMLVANTTDAATEKHVPVVVDKGDSIEVTVGSTEHPMTPEHYIAFISVLTSEGVCRKELRPSDRPMAVFPIKKEHVLEVRAFCNLHMLWKA